MLTRVVWGCLPEVLVPQPLPRLGRFLLAEVLVNGLVALAVFVWCLLVSSAFSTANGFGMSIAGSDTSVGNADMGEVAGLVWW